MKPIMLSFLSCIILLACNNESKTTQSTTNNDTGATKTSTINQATTTEVPTQDNTTVVSEDTVPGNKTTAGTTDENGCRTLQGEQWSMIKKACIKLAEADIRMDPKHNTLDPAKPAYLLFSEDKVRVEIFLPTQKKTVVIRKATDTGGADKWVNGPLSITLTDDSYALYDEGKLLYQGVKKD